MILHRPWLTGIRLLVAVVLFTGSAGIALAWQDERGPQGGDEDDQPGLIAEGEYESPQFGVSATWTDAWMVGDADDPNVEYAIGGNYDGPVASDPDLGDIVFLVDTASESAVLSLGFSPAGDAVDPEERLDALLASPDFLSDNLFLSDDAEILLADTNRDTMAVLARDDAPNDEHVVYWQVVADPGREDYSFWVGLDMYEPDEYAAVLASMEDDVEVEDNEIFAVFGPEEMLEALDVDAAEPTEEATEEATEEPTEEGTEAVTEEATEGATEEPVETEAATEDVTEEATETATKEGIIPPFEQTQTPDATEGATEEGATEEATEAAGTPVASPQASPVASPDALPGLSAEGEYESPQHGVPVTWSDAWTLDPDTAPPVQSFPETGVDALYLTDAESGEAIVYVTIENAPETFDPDATLDAVSDPAYIEQVLRMSPEAEVVLSGSREDAVAVMVVDATGDDPFVSILEVRLVDDDTVVFVELRAPASAIDEDLLNSAEDDVQVNGEDSLDLLGNQEIIDALP